MLLRQTGRPQQEGRNRTIIAKRRGGIGFCFRLGFGLGTRFRRTTTTAAARIVAAAIAVVTLGTRRRLGGRSHLCNGCRLGDGRSFNSGRFLAGRAATTATARIARAIAVVTRRCGVCRFGSCNVRDGCRVDDFCSLDDSLVTSRTTATTARARRTA